MRTSDSRERQSHVGIAVALAGHVEQTNKPHTHLNYVIEIDSRYPRNSVKELKKAKTPKDWSLESGAVAVEKVYLRGQLKGSTRAESAPELGGWVYEGCKSGCGTAGGIGGISVGGCTRTCPAVSWADPAQCAIEIRTGRVKLGLSKRRFEPLPVFVQPG